MKCPHCGLINPGESQRCDCGYDFQSGKIRESYLGAKRTSQEKKTQDAIKYALLLSITYIVVVGFLIYVTDGGFVLLTFPSWPFLTVCFTKLGFEEALIMLLTNGILVGAFSFVAFGGVSSMRKGRRDRNANELQSRRKT